MRAVSLRCRSVVLSRALFYVKCHLFVLSFCSSFVLSSAPLRNFQTLKCRYSVLSRARFYVKCRLFVLSFCRLPARMRISIGQVYNPDMSVEYQGIRGQDVRHHNYLVLLYSLCIYLSIKIPTFIFYIKKYDFNRTNNH